SSRRRHTRFDCDWSSDVCSSDLLPRRGQTEAIGPLKVRGRFVKGAFGIEYLCQAKVQHGALAVRKKRVGQNLPHGVQVGVGQLRSEERRVGKEWSSRLWQVHVER